MEKVSEKKLLFFKSFLFIEIIMKFIMMIIIINLN